MPKISVLMPVYNTNLNYLDSAIKSILDQTYENFELLILDDGSEPFIKKSIQNYKDRRIKYIPNEKNLGISKTLNNGLKCAQGEYIARMDSDDISTPKRFEVQAKYLDNNPNISLVGSWVECFPDKDVFKYIEFPSFLDFLDECHLAHPAVMFRKQDFERYDLKYDPDFDSCEDYELWTRAICYLKFANIQEVLLKYRCHLESVSSIKKDKQKKLTNIIKKRMLNFLTKDSNLYKKLAVLAHHNNPKKTKLTEKCFSIKNMGIYKVCYVLGFKFLIERK